MTLDECIQEWRSKKRRMGCAGAAAFLCKRVPGFSPLRLTRYTAAGEPYEHVVAYNGAIIIDLAPWNDIPRIR